MATFSCSSFGRRARVAFALGCLSLSGAAVAAQQGASKESTLAQARRAETSQQFGIALDRYYALLLDQPGSTDAASARLDLARLLALTGNLQSAILQCQLLRDELPAEHPLRTPALELATLLGRRLRASTPGSAYFSVFEVVPGRGVQAMDEPRTLAFAAEGRFVLVDDGAKRAYNVGPDSASVLNGPQEPTAAAVLPDGSVALAGKTGLMRVPPGQLVVLNGTWGGKTRVLKKVRSLAALAGGDLLVLDRDFDGVLRCQPATGACSPWGPIGKYRAVRVGALDWIYLLDDRGQHVRVLDATQRQITLVGPTIGAAKLGKIEDITVDAAHGLYLLDTDLKQLHIAVMLAGADGRVTPFSHGSALMPQEGERVYKNPSALGVSPSGMVYLAARSAARLMRFR